MISRLVYYYEIDMATTTIGTETGPRVVKDGRGGSRPGSGRPSNAEKLVNGTLPKPNGKLVPEDDAHFWEWLDSIKPDEWQHLICYLWRTAPIVDLSGGGKPITVEKIVHPFDATYIYKTHGSGGYRFDISQIPTDGSRQKRIRQSHQVLIDTRFAPRLSYGTWIDDPRNKDWEWAKPSLMEEAAQLASAGQPQQSNAVVDALELATKLKELSGGNADATMTGVVLQMLQNNQEALRDYQDPGKQFATLKSLMEMATPKQADNSGMGLLVEILREELRSVREDLRAVRATPNDPLSSFKGVLETLEGLGVNLRNPGTAKGGNEIASIVGDVFSKVVDKASDLAPIIVEGYKFGKQRDLEMEALKQRQQQRPWEYNANQPAPVQPAAVAPVPVAPLPDQPMTPQLLFTKYRILIMRVAPFLIDHYKNDRGGDAFREWLQETEGLNTWSAFASDATPEMLTEGIMADPQAKFIFSDKDKVLQFFDEMLNPEEEVAPEAAPDA